MRRLFLIAIMAITLASCSKDDYTGSGNTVSEFRDVNLFTKISSEGTFVVNITQGPSQSLEIIADDNIIGRVKTKISDGRLKIYLEDGNYKNTYLEANITMADLNGIKNEGIGDITVFELQSAGTMEIENIGAGNIAIAGYTDNLTILNEGSGTINCAEFMAANIDLSIEGSGDSEVYCTESLNVNIEGSGNVYYKGSPSVTKDISGSGQVIPMN
ncbi:head GIN domain-containing protein [uncultured Eudoraea sp.]|uniref:head GIN domain-containing protein n=1 Tax=uncultured Eudoraea sp. TaxID=1035614 RepID=UPI0026335F07|nr:head GIN domain-containing protein [uncultured Eudoraea sp.]